MAVTAQAGVFSFGPQAAKGTIATTWYKHRASDIDLASVSDDRLGPPEVGGIPTPSIPYRAGFMATGGALINPRLESSLGWLVYAACGAVTTHTDQDALGTTVTGMYNHEFTFATNAGYVPWVSFRKFTPGNTTSDEFGEQFRDCKVVALTLALPNDGLINARVDALGIASGQNFVEEPSWLYSNTEFEDYESIPIGSVVGSYLKVPGLSANALPITQATVTLQNAPLDVRQEKVFGSPYLEDVTIIGRQLTIDMVLKWKDPDLYQAILTGSTTGTTWTAQPFVSNLDIHVLSSVDAGALAVPYGLRIRAANVMYQIQGGIRLAGGQAVMLRVTGTAISGSGEYVQFNIANEEPSYTWPVADSAPPTISSAEVGTVNATTIIVDFSEDVKLESGSWMAGWTCEVNAAPVTITNGDRYANDKISLTLASAVTNGQTVTISYDDALGNLEDLSGNDLADVTDQAVTNNVPA